ncbi:hypothetical protein BSK66_31690 [Paenibacillus odorifer]|uniref:helix-turn-helix domain-containing protein n=1 Tax=Paenibacillus TaxID=44249 RepID=UPI0003E21AF9|nr:MULTISPECIES: helix-turn-helix domain-containing protein [Paenibacillus]ETT46234.1 hypothetical protein C171_28302 [Paenibacillus sp. FSL H8-237]OME46656.1 hypothetical protein BSK66_31690 [Paenibacillus odorifer]
MDVTVEELKQRWSDLGTIIENAKQEKRSIRKRLSEFPGYHIAPGRPRGATTKVERNNEFITLYKDGKTCTEIGSMYGISRQAVQQTLKRYGITQADSGRKPNETKCSVNGCENVGRVTKGMCPKHYSRFKKWGDPNHTSKEFQEHDPICLVDGCNKDFKAGGLCYNHYMSFKGFKKRGKMIELREFLEYQKSKASKKSYEH